VTRVRKIKEIFMFLKGTLKNSHDASGTLKGNVHFSERKSHRKFYEKPYLFRRKRKKLFPNYI
jgi:hypothetical protein